MRDTDVFATIVDNGRMRFILADSNQDVKDIVTKEVPDYTEIRTQRCGSVIEAIRTMKRWKNGLH